MNMQKTKGALRSKIMWIGMITTFLGAVQAGLPMLQVTINPIYFGVMTFAVGVLTQMARWYTSQALEDKVPQEGLQ